jgi:uncharacterized membrane protein YkvA (DUF1232 family)
MTLKDVRAWFGDKTVSKWRKLLLGVALVYVVVPFDFIPDVVPVMGWLDDLGVVSVAMASMLADVRKRAALKKGAVQVEAVPRSP